MCGLVFGYKHFSAGVHAFQKRILKPRFQVTGIVNCLTWGFVIKLWCSLRAVQVLWTTAGLLNYKIQWLLLCSELYNHQAVNFIIFLVPVKFEYLPIDFSSHFSFPYLSRPYYPGQSMIHSLPVQSCLFWSFLAN